MKQEKLRVGVIGVGHLGEYHVQKYKDLQNVEFMGVVDTNKIRAREISKKYNVKAYNGYPELLTEVDAVSLAVPTEVHFEVARKILDQRIHILIEKPITYCIKDADNLLKQAKEKGAILQVGLVERFNPAFLKMKTIFKDPILLESHRMNTFTTRGLDVDVVLDLMIHDLDIILHMVPSEIKDLHAVGMSVITEMTDVANVRIIFENGTVANLTVSRVAHKTLRMLRIFQANAYISLNYAKRELSVIEMGQKDINAIKTPQITTNKIEFFNRDPLADEIASFVDVVMKGKSPLVSGADGRRALAVALEIIEQIKKGCNNSQGICNIK